MEISTKIPENKQKIVISGNNNLLAKSYLTPLLHSNGAFWLCVNNNYEIKKLYDLINWWYLETKTNLPSIITWPSETELTAKQYYLLIKSNKVIIITTPNNLLEKVITIEEFNNQTLTLSVGNKINHIEVKKHLVNLEYEANKQADDIGLFSQRGHIIDIWSPQNPYPLRIELDNDKIENIYSIDLLSKKKLKLHKEINILPVKLNTSFKTSLLSLINERHNILIDQSSLLDISQILETNFKHIFEIKPIQEKGSIITLNNSNYFYNNYLGLKEYISKFKPHIITQDKNRVNNLLHEFKINTTVSEFKLFTIPGIEDINNNKHFLTDANIFKSETTHTNTKNNIYNGDIKPGDFVVHRDHGIAKFTKTVLQTVDEIEREYYLLQYHGEDRLYLPIDQVDRISKYLGVKNPKLHKLGAASTWPQVIRKVKEDIIKMAQQLLNLYARRELSEAIPLIPHPEEENRLAASFPYEETPDQSEALKMTLNDLNRSKPTDRLICGDVGFGKTEIAIRAAYRTALNNQQVILLCPTTILAQQHYDTFIERFKDYPIKINLLSRFVNNKQQTENIKKINDGITDIIIGTHRLLSKDIKFKNTGLIIIDEEQQFGVKDKEKLKDLKTSAHIISLSATPIPRTLNLSMSGVRDISIIATPPEGRLPIKTSINQFSEDIIKDAINKEIARNGQVYYLYNKVETIDEQLKYLKKLLPKYRYGVVHGQLSAKDISATMHDFDTGNIDVLICSTIIANGLDLANVNTLIVTGAQNFGLAQLYQIRGRIGRSFKQAYAYFLYNAQKLKGRSAERLQALQEAEALGSGFQIATRDMEIRGIGNILGKKQHGKVSLIGLTLYNELISQTVTELKTGLIPTPLVDTTIDLPLSIGLPINFLKSESGKLKFYQLIANCNSIDKLNDHFKRLPKPWPQKVKNLKEISELRILSEQAGINLITAKNHRNLNEITTYIYIHFSEELDYVKVSKLLNINPSWEFKDNRLKIDINKLNTNWLLDIKNTIILFI